MLRILKLPLCEVRMNSEDIRELHFLKSNAIKQYVSVNKQDRQCTYNVTLRRVRVTIVAVEKQ